MHRPTLSESIAEWPAGGMLPQKWVTQWAEAAKALEAENAKLLASYHFDHIDPDRIGTLERKNTELYDRLAELRAAVDR